MQKYLLLAAILFSLNIHAEKNPDIEHIEWVMDDLNKKQESLENQLFEIQQKLNLIPVFPSNYCIAAMLGSAFVGEVGLAVLTDALLKKYKVPTKTTLAAVAIIASCSIGAFGGMFLAHKVCNYYKI